MFLLNMQVILRSYRNYQKMELEEDFAKLWSKIGSFRQSRAEYLQQHSEIHRNWTGKEKFGIYFLVIFKTYCKCLVFWKETVHQLCAHPS